MNRLNGILLYTPEDAARNRWFIEQLCQYAESEGMSLRLCLSDAAKPSELCAVQPGFLIKPRQRKAWQNQSNKNSNYNAYLAESIDGVRVSQLFDRQEVNISIMEKLAGACRKAWLRAIRISNMVWLSSETMTQLVLTFLYIAGVYWMGGGKMVSFGVILAMGQYVSRFWQPITNLANIYNSFVNNIAYLERKEFPYWNT